MAIEVVIKTEINIKATDKEVNKIIIINKEEEGTQCNKINSLTE